MYDDERSGRPLPQNLDAERTLLSAIMVRNEALFEATDYITKADFFEPANGELFDLMRDQIENGRRVSALTLMHDFAQDSDIGGIRASEYLRRLEDMRAPASMVKEYALGLKDLAMKRRLIAVANTMAEECYNAPVSMPGEYIREKYDDAFNALFQSGSAPGIKHESDIAGAMLDRMGSPSTARAGLSVGIKGVEDLTGPLLPGRLYILAGASAIGKSRLAQQIGTYIARPVAEGRPKSVLFESIEMSGEEMVARDLSSATGVKAEAIDREDVRSEEYDRLVEAAGRRKASGFYIDRQYNVTAAQIGARAMRHKKLKGLDLLIVDHLLRVQWADPRQREHEAIRQICQRHKSIAEQLDIPVLLLAQLKASFADDKIVRAPHAGDLYGGAAVEQEADVLFFVHRPEHMLARREPPKSEEKARAEWEGAMMAAEGRAQIILGKRRGGISRGVRTIGFGEGDFQEEPWKPKYDYPPMDGELF